MVFKVFLLVVCSMGFFKSWSQQEDQKADRTLKHSDFPLFGKLVLGKNEPNPFFTSESTTITYKAYAALSVDIVIYDMKGNRMKNFNNLPQGDGKITLAGSELPSGIYYYALLANGRIVEKRELTILTPLNVNGG